MKTLTLRKERFAIEAEVRQQLRDGLVTTEAEAQREAELELSVVMRKHGIFPQSVTSWLEVVAQHGYVEAFNYSAVVSAGLNAFLHRREVQRLKREKAYLEQRKSETHRDAQTLAALAAILATGKDILAALGGPRRHDG